MTYKEQIENIPSENALNTDLTIQQKASAEFKLSWSHYQVLMRIPDKNTDSIVQLTLPPNANIYASEYSLYLPDKELLQKKLDEWTQEYKYDQDNSRN